MLLTAENVIFFIYFPEFYFEINILKTTESWSSFDTSKWTIFVPDEVIKSKDIKILIIDDLTNSSETIEKLTQHLVDCGVNSKKYLVWN